VLLCLLVATCGMQVATEQKQRRQERLHQFNARVKESNTKPKHAGPQVGAAACRWPPFLWATPPMHAAMSHERHCAEQRDWLFARPPTSQILDVLSFLDAVCPFPCARCRCAALDQVPIKHARSVHHRWTRHSLMRKGRGQALSEVTQSACLRRKAPLT